MAASCENRDWLTRDKIIDSEGTKQRGNKDIIRFQQTTIEELEQRVEEYRRDNK